MTEFSQIMEALSGIVGQEQVITDPPRLAEYTVDGARPRGVVFPRDTKQVAEVVESAREEGLAVVPWGSGTKMTMGHPPDRVDLVIGMARMNHMLDVDTANLTITVEAGVKFRDIQARLGTEDDRCYLPLDGLVTEAGELICSDRAHSGCFLPMDPPFSEKATIGGIIATNSTGPRRLLYGLPRDLILGVRFVTPQGEVIGAGGKTVKNVSGYDISKLMIGSMGSLGILCEMTLRLLPLPERMETLLLSFDAFSDACAFAKAVFGTKLLPAAVEVINRVAYENMVLRSPLDFRPGPYVVVLAIEAFAEAVSRMHKELLVMAEHFGAKGHAHLHEDEHRLFWVTVSDLPASLAKQAPGLVTLQIGYPFSEWTTLFEYADRSLSEIGIQHAMLCHAGSGTSVIHLLMDPESADMRGKIPKAVDGLLARCRAVGGNLVVQRAPAGGKKDLPIWGEPGSDAIVMKRIRQELDPFDIMSPGRFAVVR